MMKIAIIILMIELSLLLFSFGCMVCVRLVRNWQEKETIHRRKLLKELLANSIQKHEVLHLDQINPRLLRYQDLLATVETFDRLFLDSIWQETKQHLIDTYLGKKALLFAQSSSWRDRQLGLRCIALNPKQLMNKQVVVPLLNDSKFIVRILAASSMIHAEQKDLLLAVLKRMIQEPEMGRYAYRDLLINSEEITFQWMEEIANEETDPALIASCLDVLSTKITHNLLPLAIKHLGSSDLACRLAAIKILSSIPGDESKKYLSQMLCEKNGKIRAEAAQGLGKILALSSIPDLSIALQDSEWFVRLQAATALKSMGKEGRAALYRQDPQQNLDAYEIAQYILAIPEIGSR